MELRARAALEVPKWCRTENEEGDKESERLQRQKETEEEGGGDEEEG